MGIGDQNEERKLKEHDDDVFKLTDCEYDPYILDCMHTIRQCQDCNHFMDYLLKVAQL